MRLCKVNHEEICHITEVLDKLFELVKFVKKWGSGAASETQNQWTVPCQEDCISNSVCCKALLSNSFECSCMHYCLDYKTNLFNVISL